MKYLAVDYGTKRVGLAVSDELEMGAYPLATVTRGRNLTHDLQEIVRLANREEIEAIVVGLPLNADGSHGPSADAATAFAKSLGKQTPLPITLHDEFLTTFEAEEDLIAADVSRAKRRRIIDQMAAVKLLESFLRARHEQREKGEKERNVT